MHQLRTLNNVGASDAPVRVFGGNVINLTIAFYSLSLAALASSLKEGAFKPSSLRKVARR